MKNLQLTPLEQQILERSDTAETTRQRRSMVLATGIGFASLLVIVALATRSWHHLLAIALAYIAITICEKVAYANAVLGYKSLIQKLRRRIEEGEDESNQQ